MQDQGESKGFWVLMTELRAVEFWVALVGSAIYVYLNSKEKGHTYRWFMVASSAMLGFSVAPDLAKLTDLGETFCGVLITVFGYVAIDMITALTRDQTFLKNLLLSRFMKK